MTIDAAGLELLFKATIGTKAIRPIAALRMDGSDRRSDLSTKH
jgi:hypothetical protein